MCGILPDDGCGKEVNCGGCQVANKMCNNQNHRCEVVPGPPCPALVCGGHTGPGPGPSPAMSPAPSPFPVSPFPAPGPAGPAGPAGPGGPGGAPEPAPAPAPEVTPIDVPKNLEIARATAAEEVYRIAHGLPPRSTSTLQMPQASQTKQKLSAVGLSGIRNVAGQAPFVPIPHGGNLTVRNALPNAEPIVAEQAVLAVNDTLWTEKPFYAALDSVKTEQDKLRAEIKQKIDGVVKGLAWDAERRAEESTRAVLMDMPLPVVDAGVKRLRRTLFDRITQHVPGHIIAPDPAPGPAPMPAVDTPEGDADSKEIQKQMKTVAEKTLQQATAEIDDTKKWVNRVADQYTIDATLGAVKEAWPISQEIGQQMEMQMMSGDVTGKAQHAFLYAMSAIKDNAAAAARIPADKAAFSVAPEAVQVATKSATEALSTPIARQSLLNAQHVLGAIATGVVIDQLDDRVQEIRTDANVAHHIDSTFQVVNQNAPEEFAKLAKQTANNLIAQMKKGAQAAKTAGSSPAPALQQPGAPP